MVIYILLSICSLLLIVVVILLKKKMELELEKHYLEKKIKEEAELKDRLKLEFENLSNRIFLENSSRLQRESEKSLFALLAPFKEKIETFQKRVEETYTQESRERFSLKSVIETMMQSSDKLSSALRGDIKAQGAWGEVVLKKVLEASGLSEGREYSFQKSFSPDEGDQLRPDVVVNLPEDRQIIIDSKVSLKQYENYLSAENKDIQENRLKEFINSLENHVDELSRRNYSFLKETNSPKMVLMFVPIEAVFSLVVQSKRDLFEKAWKKSIVICSPANLLAILKTIESLWKVELHSRNAQKIAYEGSRLYDKFVGFLEDLEEVGRALNSASKAHSDAFNKLKTGRGSVISHVENLKELGLQTKKEIKGELIFNEQEDTE